MNESNDNKPEIISEGLLTAGELLKAVFPNDKARPSLRWLRSLQAKRAIPYTKVGRRVFFEAARVKAALRKYEIPAAK